MELACWEFAEAATAERRATQLRTSAAKRITSIRFEFKEALEIAKTNNPPRASESNITAPRIGLRYNR